MMSDEEITDSEADLGFDILLFGVYAQLNTRISPSLSPNLNWVFLGFIKCCGERQTQYDVE